MALTKEQRAFLEKAGIDVARIKLMNYDQTGSQGMVGFSREMIIVRADVEGWVSEETRQDQKQQRRILRWAMIGGCAAIAGAILTAVALFKP
jgi:hypothetical protein